MISCIICSNNPSLLKNVSENIERTIGVDFEIIPIDNTSNQNGICQAYNSGAVQSKYPYLCFVHEDVAFVTKNWGDEILKHFANHPEAGLIGVAGTTYKTKISAPWWQSDITEYEPKRINLIQGYKHAGKHSKHNLINPLNESISEVVALDGVLLITPKNIWETNKFDETILKGFHGYDLDFSLQVGRYKKLYVVYNILIEHFSEGNCDVNCLLTHIEVHKKWNRILPISSQNIFLKESLLYDRSWKRLRKTMQELIHKKLSFWKIVKNYNIMVNQLHGRPSYIVFFTKYFLEMYKISKNYYSFRSKQ